VFAELTVMYSSVVFLTIELDKLMQSTLVLCHKTVFVIIATVLTLKGHHQVRKCKK